MKQTSTSGASDSGLIELNFSGSFEELLDTIDHALDEVKCSVPRPGVIPWMCRESAEVVGWAEERLGHLFEWLIQFGYVP